MTLTTVNSDGVKDDSIKNIDIKSDAAIEGSKLDNPLQLPDDHKISFGTTGTGDLEIYHSSGNSFIHDGGAGGLYIRGSILGWRDAGNSNASWINTNSGAGVELYYAGNKKIETTSNGITVTHTAATAVTIVGANNTDSGIYFNDGANQGAVIYQHNGDYMSFRTSGTDDTLRIDSSGNIGIGITPDTQGNTVKSIQLGTATNLYNESSDDYTILGNNVYFDGTNNKYIKTQESSRLLQNAGELTFNQAASGSADANITYTTPFKIDSAGTVSIKKDTYLSSSSTITSRLTLNSDNTSSWTGTRELVALDLIGNGADHRTGTLSIKCKKASGDSSPTEMVRVDGVHNLTKIISGNLDLVDGDLKVANTHGIDFSAVSDGSRSVTSNILTDYEAGAWTPALANGGSATVYSCRYTKIGREVTIHAYAYYSSTPNDSNDFQINGLPFTVSSDTSNLAGGFMFYGGSLNVTTIAPYASGNSTSIRFYAIDGAGSGGTKVNSSFYGTGPDATRYLNFKLIYYTD